MTHTLWLWIGIIAALPSPTTALTVDEAVRMALTASPLLRSAQRATDAQDATISQARSGYYPRLVTQSRYTRQSEVDPFRITIPAAGPGPPRQVEVSPVVTNVSGVKAQVQQALFTAGRTRGRVETATHQTAAAQARHDQTRADLIFRVKQVYWEAVRAMEVFRQAQDGIRRVQAHRADLEHMRDVGMAVERDLLQATVQEEETWLQVIRAEQRRDFALIELKSLLGLPLDRELVLSDLPVPTETVFGAIDESVRQALAQRPDLAGARVQLEVARSSVRTARSEWYPHVSLLLNMDYARPNMRFVPLRDDWRRSWEAGVTFTWEAYDGGYRSARSAEAQARLDAAEAQAEEAARQVTVDVHRAIRDAALSFQAWNVAHVRVTAAQEHTRVTRAQFTQGLALSSDVLDAENRLLAAQTDRTSAGIDWMIAQAALNRALGREKQ